jgi:flagellar L-ring protein precursor FlgH
MLKLVTVLGSVLALTACSGTIRELRQIGQVPPMAPMTYPTVYPSAPVEVAAMPAAYNQATPANSLWKSGARAFFNDQRASKVGDILTVRVSIADSAKVKNTSSAKRDSERSSELTGLMGFESSLGKVLPNAVDPGALADFKSGTSTKGDGSIDRAETIDTTIAAVIMEVMPNGNMVISGRQEVRINNEVRELLITGIVRPEDISASNTIKSTQIAEARISYGGRGMITKMQQAPYGQQAADLLMPF